MPDLIVHRLNTKNESKWYTCADFNQQNSLICGTDEGYIFQTNSPSNEEFNFQLTQTFFGHRKLITDLCFIDTNNDFFLSSSADNDIRLWRLYNSQSITIYRSHLSPVWCLAVHAGSDRFASGSMDRTIRLWTPERTNILRTLMYSNADINTLAFHPNGKYLCSGSADGWIVLWSLEQAKPARVLQANSSVEQIKFTSDGNQLISITTDFKSNIDTLSQWDIRSTKETCLIKDIPHTSVLLKPCQIEQSQLFLTATQQSLLFFHLQDQNKLPFRIDLSNYSIKRLIHLASTEPNKLVAIGE